MHHPHATIIIPCKNIDPLAEQCLWHCSRLDYGHFDVIVLPDYHHEVQLQNVTIISTGPIYPGAKRNIGIQHARGEFCAFIDADAHPREDWLRKALACFIDDDVACVGGPNLLPTSATLAEQVSNDILYCKMGVGFFPQKKYRDNLYQVKEVAASNLVGRRNIIQKTGGFDPILLTGEDAKLCFQLARAGYKVLYSSDVVVYHHRKPFLLPHLQAIRVYGRDKALLLKELWSYDKLYYFLPSFCLVILLLSLIGSCIHPFFLRLLGLLLGTYFVAVCLQVVALSGLIRKFLVAAGIPLTHAAYGLGFLQGIFSNKFSLYQRWLSRKEKIQA